jgi:uncharacterized protein (TIGR02265 family)
MLLAPDIRALVEETDLEERLPKVPPSARLRGLYFKNTEAVLQRAGLLEKFRTFFPAHHSAVRWYPVSDFLVQAAVGAALLEGKNQVAKGLQLIGRNNAVAFAESLLGRTMIRLLARDPVKLLKQAAAGRRQSCAYGRWEVQFTSPNSAVIEMFEEYLWIESNVLGAAIGTFEATGHRVEVQVELESMFRGRHTLTWFPNDATAATKG